MKKSKVKMYEKKKAQGAVELAIVISALLLAFTLLLAFIQAGERKTTLKNEYEALSDIGYIIKQELSVASNALDGYVREFKLPEKAYGKSYSIDVEKNNTLILKTKDVTFLMVVPSFVGNFTKGMNKIEKINGIIYVNRE
ncbi:hypothetical protein B6U82_00635 [Candidatus Pacearchaeota archaeon ex4484_31]|nr:MAG: hypothetical protein B6U82_00635 [Candidatus Pacearchaeota archaeon ex4484_31]